MQWRQRASYAILALSQIVGVASVYNCPIPGAQLPPPRNLATHPIWLAAMKNLSQAMSSTWEVNASNYSFSIQVFSTNPGDDVVFERFHTDPTLPANTTGVKKVDQDTIYRLGSITKLYTVMAFLAKTGNKYFNDPITMYVPELAAIQAKTRNSSVDDIRYVDWDSVSLWSLAAQISGIATNYGVLGEVTQFFDNTTWNFMGFPTITDSLPPCGIWPLCNRTQFFEGVATLYPSFAPWTTPAYSNFAYQLLAYALENITGEAFADILNDKILQPLGLNHTYYWYANETLGIIPGNNGTNGTGWNEYFGDGQPGGGIYASAKDLSTIGRAILSSQVIKPVVTRQWLQPSSFPADSISAVGAPWGIRRIPLSATNPDQTTPVFTKAGGLGKYGGIITLIPDFKLGFTILTAGDTPSAIAFPMADTLGSYILPAFNNVRKDEARRRFGGNYTVAANTTVTIWGNGTAYGNSSVEGPRTFPMNSSLVLTTDLDRPGLGVTQWFSNGTDMIPTSLWLQSEGAPFGPNTTASVRLYFTGLETKRASGNRRQAFKAVFEDIGAPAVPGTGFTSDCGNWVAFAGVTYGSYPLDEFIFELSPAGDVLSVENTGLWITLQKVSGVQ